MRLPSGSHTALSGPAAPPPLHPLPSSPGARVLQEGAGAQRQARGVRPAHRPGRRAAALDAGAPGGRGWAARGASTACCLRCWSAAALLGGWISHNRAARLPPVPLPRAGEGAGGGGGHAQAGAGRAGARPGPRRLPGRPLPGPIREAGAAQGRACGRREAERWWRERQLVVGWRPRRRVPRLLDPPVPLSLLTHPPHPFSPHSPPTAPQPHPPPDAARAGRHGAGRRPGGPALGRVHGGRVLWVEGWLAGWLAGWIHAPLGMLGACTQAAA